MSLLRLLNPVEFRKFQLLWREAKRLDIEFDELSTEDGIRALYRRVDPTTLGLPADEDVTADPLLDRPGLAEAHQALLTGEWEPVARLLAEHGDDWARRSLDVDVLASTAAADSTALDRWQYDRPDDPHLLVLRAEMLVRRAWNARGSAIATETSDEQFSAFYRLLDEAEPAAWAATEAAPHDPTPWATLVTLARAQQWSEEALEHAFTELCARAPHHRGGHDAALQYWCAKWYGSHERMFAFADEAAAKSPSLTPLRLTAVFEYSVGRKRPRPKTYAREAMNATAAWLAGDGADSPYAHFDRGLLASVLVDAKRYDEAVEQFRLLGSHADSWAWQYTGNARLAFLLSRWTACRHARRFRR